MLPGVVLPESMATGGEPLLVDGAGVQAERRRVQTGGRVAEVGLLDPQQRRAVLALLALAAVAALVAHEQHGDEEDAEDGERVEEDEVEEGLVGADDRLDGGHCRQRTDPNIESSGPFIQTGGYPRHTAGNVPCCSTLTMVNPELLVARRYQALRGLSSHSSTWQ